MGTNKIEEGWIIYVLECEQGRYYVGRTRNLAQRFEQHLSGGGSQWTSMYAPIRIDQEIPTADRFDEDKWVKKYMAQFGIDRVRGGSYSKIDLPRDQRLALEREIDGALDRCLKCGREGHFARSCRPEFYMNESQSRASKSETCFRCGRAGHYVADCIARTHVNGSALLLSSEVKDVPSCTCYRCGQSGHVASDCYANVEASRGAAFHRSDHSNSNTGQWRSSSNLATFPSSPPQDGKCFRCGRSGHFSSECFAKTDINGYALSGPAPSRPNQSTRNCYRCGRSGHYSTDCYASKDVYGSTIRDYDSSSSDGY